MSTRSAPTLALLALVSAGCGDGGGDSSSTATGSTTPSGTTTTTTTTTSTATTTGTPTATGDLYHCDQRTLQDQCTEYTDLTPDELAVTEQACGTSQGVWNVGTPCPDGWDAACHDYANGTLVISSYYYGNIGLTENQCTGFGGTWESTLPDYPGSCWPDAYECQAWEAEWDTPESVQAACGAGTYSPDYCPATDLLGTCTVAGTSRTYHYYAGHPDIAFVRDTLCGLMGGVWADA